MSGIKSVADAQQEAEAARARLFDTVDEIQARMAPSRLLEDTIEGVKTGSIGLARDAGTMARERPALVAGAAIFGTVLLARNPLIRLGRRILRRPEETTPDDFGLAQDVTKG